MHIYFFQWHLVKNIEKYFCSRDKYSSFLESRKHRPEGIGLRADKFGDAMSRRMRSGAQAATQRVLKQ